MDREREDAAASAATASVRSQRRRKSPASYAGTDLISLLPTSLIQEHIFGFFAAPALFSAEEITPRELDAQLQPLRGVCHRWEAAVRTIRGHVKSWKHTLDFQCGDDDEFEQLLGLAEANGSTIQHLEVTMGVGKLSFQPKYCQPHRGLIVNRKTEVLGELDWPLLFRQFPNIVRLDLSVTLIQHLPVILAAAHVACPRVQTLILPYAQSWREPDAAEITRALQDALQHWRECNGGLRLLHVPYWPLAETRCYEDLFAAIVAHCPRMEQLQGWHTDSKTNRVVSMRHATMRVIQDFCMTCLAYLRTFHWNLMSLNQSTLALFNAVPKPRLEKLVVDERWSNTVDPPMGTGNIIYRRIEAGLEMIESMLTQTPTLRYLEIVVYDHAFLENTGSYRGVTTTVADAFVLALVNKFPRLQEFHYNMSSPEKAVALTGTAVVALVGLRSIKNLVVGRVVFRATSLVDVVQEAFTGKRVSALSIKLTAADAAHGSLCDLLAYLAANPSPWSGGHRPPFSLEVIRERMENTAYPRAIPRADLITPGDLKRLVDGINSRYADQRFHVMLQVYSYGRGPLRLAIGELQLRVNDSNFGYRSSSDDQSVCEIECTHVLEHAEDDG